jgi:hypothetical protein
MLDGTALHDDLLSALHDLEALEKEMRLHVFVCTRCGHSWRADPEPRGRLCICGYYAAGSGYEAWADRIGRSA